ncbi:STY0301 family protein [Pelomonas sp. Root1444]|uniref:STY0301 family protein n=1 Tax=Pelomonas sp. Root1444 TaxID=1736464 RepID=UPI0012F9AB0D|nr:STY0301 family protein [Pelomonas sp. Root1444]
MTKLSLARSLGRLPFVISMLGIAFLPKMALCQECPQFRQVDEAADMVDGWTLINDSTVLFLKGLEIIEGKIHKERSDNVILAPISKGANEYYWNFPKSIGKAEAWMICSYGGGNARLAHRIMPEAKRCSVFKVGGDSTKFRSGIRAVCE